MLTIATGAAAPAMEDFEMLPKSIQIDIGIIIVIASLLLTRNSIWSQAEW
jgi:hypothetical protein